MALWPPLPAIAVKKINFIFFFVVDFWTRPLKKNILFADWWKSHLPPKHPTEASRTSNPFSKITLLVNSSSAQKIALLSPGSRPKHRWQIHLFGSPFGGHKWYHLESRWHNSHVLVYHVPLQIATFWEWLAIYFHHGVNERSKKHCWWKKIGKFSISTAAGCLQNSFKTNDWKADLMIVFETNEDSHHIGIAFGESRINTTRYGI